MAPVRKALRDAADALSRADPALAEFIADYGPPRIRPPGRAAGRFAALVRAICFQQLAGRAAATIHGRFEALFDGAPTPEAVLDRPVADLRSSGLSASKAASIRDLARKVLDGSVELDRMGRLPDARVVEELVTVRGIGEWTAQMFLIFQLGRLDVWPTGDLGVRNGYRLIHGLASAPTPRKLEPLGGRYAPYRSVAAWYCWRATDVLTP